jgi:hypothetical protein
MKINIISIIALFVFCFTISENAYSQRSGKNTTKTKTNTKKVTNATKKVKADSLLLELKAPPSIKAEEIFETMSQGKRPGVKVNIPNADPLTLANNWKRYLKTYGGKTRDKKGEFVSDDLTIAKLSENTVDVYSKVEAYPGGVLLKAFFDLGGAYVSAKVNKDKFAVVEKILHDFASQQATTAIKGQLVNEEANLLELGSDRDILQMSEAQLLDDIKKYKAALAKAEAALANNHKEQAKQNAKTEKQIATIEQLRLDLDAVTVKPKAPSKPKVEQNKDKPKK